MKRPAVAVALFLFVTCPALAEWPRHTIDDLGRGADGVRLADVDGDGLDDIVTGWEESGHVCLYLCPPTNAIRDRWPRVVVGKAKGVEDAVAVDLDGDGIHEIVSCHEGNTKAILVHSLHTTSGTVTRDDALNPKNWKSNRVRSCDGVSRWMFATGLRMGAGSQQQHVLAVASKEPNGQVSLLSKSPSERKSAGSWNLIQLQPAGWVMSLVSLDMDHDGDEDLVVSDRKGTRRGVYWLEQPNDRAVVLTPNAWQRHDVGGSDSEVMFLDAQANRIVVATRGNGILQWDQSSLDGKDAWEQTNIESPFGVINGKAVRRFHEHNRDWIVFTANRGVNQADRDKPVVSLLSVLPERKEVDVSGDAGKKFDRIEVRDLDQDGDLDIITCEERDNLGVVWYENPGWK